MKLKPYEAYKDSGVEWLGRVPIGWTLTRLKFIASSTKGKNPPEILDEQVDGSLPYLSMDYLRSQVEPKFAYIDKSSCKVDDGKVLLLWDGANAGEFIKGKSGILSSTSALLNPSSTLQKDYFWFYCKTIEHDVRRQAVGMGIPHVNGDELKSTVFAKPSFVEQQQIATFLDRETTKIDTLISKQEKLIALLQENRQAVISNAVTKGLNPDAPMKDSGVEWLGMVPVGWARTQIKHIVKIPVTDGPHETPDFIDDGVPFVSAEAVSSGVIDFNKIRGYISKEANEIYSLKYSPKRNDIYMVKSGATTGVAAIVDTDLDFNIWSPLAVIRCNENMSQRCSVWSGCSPH